MPSKYFTLLYSPTLKQPLTAKSPMKNTLIVVMTSRLFLYDYNTDNYKQINERDLQQKTIRSVCAYSQTKICVGLGDGSFKIVDTMDLHNKTILMVKSVRGFHTKAVTWMLPYSQAQNDLPRLITASAADGMMACWNLSTILMTGTNSQVHMPSFQFKMAKGNKRDSNNGEEILELGYDAASYRLLTLTESYITLWSTMTGMELKRIPNQKFKSMSLFNHFAFPLGSLLAHTQGTILTVLTVRTTGQKHLIETQEQIDLSAWLKEGPNVLPITQVRVQPTNPSIVFIMTNNTLSVIQVDKFYRMPFGIHPSFSTKLTTISCKDYVVKAEQLIKTEITAHYAQSLKFQEDILYNSFYIMTDGQWVYFELVEVQYQNMLHQLRKFKMYNLSGSPLYDANGQTTTQVNSKGNTIMLFNNILCAYQVLITNDRTRIDFYSKFISAARGYCRDVAWHPEKDEFAALVGLYGDHSGKIVGYDIQRHKNRKDRMKAVSDIRKWGIVIFVLTQTPNGVEYLPIRHIDIYHTKIYRLTTLSDGYGYSVIPKDTVSNNAMGQQKLGVICTDGERVQALAFPERIFHSFDGGLQILAYDGYFIMMKAKGGSQQLTYFRTVYQTIVSGLFWSNYFFYATQRDIVFLHLLDSDVRLVRIAQSLLPFYENQLLQYDVYIDDLAAQPHPMPEGHLQIFGIVNMHLVLLTKSHSLSMLSLKRFPYIDAAIKVACGATQCVNELIDKCSPSIAAMLKRLDYQSTCGEQVIEETNQIA